ncbi:hypothetical protein AALB47_24805 [Lachnospiraceae bacterium 54-11]
MSDKESSRPVYDADSIKVEGIEPTPEMKELLEKEKRGEITRDEIRRMFDRGYRMKQ